MLKDLPGENKELEAIMVDPIIHIKGLAEILDLVQVLIHQREIRKSSEPNSFECGDRVLRKIKHWKQHQPCGVL